MVIAARSHTGYAYIPDLPVDLGLPQQKSPLIQLLASHPAGDLGVALAGVARTATRHNISELVSSAARYGQNAILLQRCADLPAVRAATPGQFQCIPLQIGEVVHLRGDTPPATTCVPGCARWPSGRHRLRLARGGTSNDLESGVSTWIPRRRDVNPVRSRRRRGCAAHRRRRIVEGPRHRPQIARPARVDHRIGAALADAAEIEDPCSYDQTDHQQCEGRR